jgi:hypothetical protein
MEKKLKEIEAVHKAEISNAETKLQQSLMVGRLQKLQLDVAETDKTALTKQKATEKQVRILT